LTSAKLSAVPLYEEAQAIKAKINEKMANYGTNAQVRIEGGNEAETIVKCADDLQADFIVIGAAGKHGGVRGRLGSVADKVVNKNDCSVMVIR